MRFAPRIDVGAVLAFAVLAFAPLPALAQAVTADPGSAAPFGDPMGAQPTYVHGLLDQLEGRLGADQSFKWEGEGWVGGDENRLWVKSEGEVTDGRVEDGQQEILYSRPITPYFNLQAGGRYDLDSAPGRGWGALGIEGFAPYYFTVSATAYASDTGHYAARLEGSDDIRFTQRLILEPQAELNFYTRADPARRVASGLSDLDAGLRLRYEITRKFAPYVGLTYENRFAGAAPLVRGSSERIDELRLTAGVRTWF